MSIDNGGKMKFNYKRIKPIRKSKGLTQGDVALYLSQRFNKNYNRSTISSKEVGRNPFSLEELDALAEYLEVDLDEFFDGGPKPQPQPQRTQETGMTQEVQSYLLKRIQDLEAEVKELKANPQTGAATPTKHSKK
jgi:transcriptional regulator with XRE-family HTH domain